MGKSGKHLDWQTYQAVVVDILVHERSVKDVAKIYELSRSTVEQIMRLYWQYRRLRIKFLGE